MNRFRLLLNTTLMITVLFSYAASAAEVWLEGRPTGSGIAYSLFLNGAGVGLFNTIGVRITPAAPSEFLNYDADGFDDITPAATYQPGADITFINAELFLDREGGGLGYAGVFDPSNGADLIDFATGPLGQWIDPTEVGFLANFVLPDEDAEFEVQLTLLNTGNVVYEFQGVPPIVPEPSSLASFVFGLSVVVIRRMR